MTTKIKFKKGFTLIEILGSILILSLLAAVSSQITYGNFKKAQKAKILRKSNTLLQLKMSELEAEYKNESIISLPNEDKGKFEQEPNYSWEYITQPFQMPSALTLLQTQELAQNDINIKVIEVIRDILTKTIIELKLTVVYSKGLQQLKYSLSSYFVNYAVLPFEVQQSLQSIIPEATFLQNLQTESDADTKKEEALP